MPRRELKDNQKSIVMQNFTVDAGANRDVVQHQIICRMDYFFREFNGGLNLAVCCLLLFCQIVREPRFT